MSTEPTEAPSLRDEILSHLIIGQRVAIIAPRLEISRAVFLEVLAHFRTAGTEAAHTAGHRGGGHRLELPNGAELRTVSTAPGAIRGMTFDAVVLIDEPVPSEAIAPALAAGQLGQIIHATHPAE